jgi:hypothetical protein
LEKVAIVKFRGDSETDKEDEDDDKVDPADVDVTSGSISKLALEDIVDEVML